MGIGFCETESLKEIEDKIVIIKEIKFNEDTQAIAVLNPNSQSRVTKEFLKYLFKRQSSLDTYKATELK